jgi:hypothetical protein
MKVKKDICNREIVCELSSTSLIDFPFENTAPEIKENCNIREVSYT